MRVLTSQQTFTKDESQPSNGSITASGTGGTPSYTYSWLYPDGVSTDMGETIDGLTMQGQYKLTITDAYGCTSPELTIDLAGCVGLEAMLIDENVTYPTSGTSNDGAIDLTVSKGSGNFSYSWSGLRGIPLLMKIFTILALERMSYRNR